MDRRSHTFDVCWASWSHRSNDYSTGGLKKTNLIQTSFSVFFRKCFAVFLILLQKNTAECRLCSAEHHFCSVFSLGCAIVHHHNSAILTAIPLFARMAIGQSGHALQLFSLFFIVFTQWLYGKTINISKRGWWSPPSSPSLKILISTMVKLRSALFSRLAWNRFQTASQRYTVPGTCTWYRCLDRRKLSTICG